MQFINDLGLVALGSRLKALSDQLYTLADEVYLQRGLGVQGRWFPVLRVLHDHGPQTIGEVAGNIGQSHSAVSQLATKLIKLDWLQALEDPQDRRCRRLALTEQARSVIRLAKPIWRAIEQTLETRTKAVGIDVLATLSAFESIVDESLVDQINESCDEIMAKQVTVVPFAVELRAHFYSLNEEWLRSFFYLEEIDHRILSNPETEILEPGGAIFFAKLGDAVVGTCALIVEEDGTMELSKMGVDPKYQGLGIGRALIDAALDEFRASAATQLVLETNAKLQPAIALYESVGFVHQPNGKPNSAYARSDVYMIWRDPNLES